MSPLGQRIGPVELKARWAWSELESSRFAVSYRKPGKDPLFDKRISGASFEELDAANQADLVDRITHNPNRSCLVSALDQFPNFKCEEWTRADIMLVRVVPILGGLTLEELVKLPLQNDLNHPIDAASKIPIDQEFHQDEPVIVLPVQSNGTACQLLLEGTLRAVLFLRSGQDKICVWFPT